MLVHDVFTAENGISLPKLDQLEITGLVQLPDLNNRQVQSVDKFVVSSVINLDAHGAPADICVAVFRKKRILKIQANRLFPNAVFPDGKSKMIQLDNIDYGGFLFPPSQLWSSWVSSSDVGAKLMISNNKVNGFHLQEEWAEYGVGPFMLRLAVEPGRDPDMAIVRLHALPGDRENLATYRGNPEVCNILNLNPISP